MTCWLVMLVIALSGLPGGLLCLDHGQDGHVGIGESASDWCHESAHPTHDCLAASDIPVDCCPDIVVPPIDASVKKVRRTDDEATPRPAPVWAAVAPIGPKACQTAANTLARGTPCVDGAPPLSLHTTVLLL